MSDLITIFISVVYFVISVVSKVEFWLKTVNTGFDNTGIGIPSRNPERTVRCLIRVRD